MRAFDLGEADLAGAVFKFQRLEGQATAERSPISGCGGFCQSRFDGADSARTLLRLREC